jgi:hypothetical protein
LLFNVKGNKHGVDNKGKNENTHNKVVAAQFTEKANKPTEKIV